MGEIYLIDTGEALAHFGVKGMKWGHRKASYQSAYAQSKGAVRSARRGLVESRLRAASSSYAHPLGIASPTKKGRAAFRKSMNDYNNANYGYKAAKNNRRMQRIDRKQQIQRNHRNLNTNTSLGQHLLYNDATRKLAAKRMYDKGMSQDEAYASAKKTANRNALLMGGAYGAALAYQNRDKIKSAAVRGVRHFTEPNGVIRKKRPRTGIGVNSPYRLPMH